MLDPVFVDDQVAFSPMPSRGEEPAIAANFDLVVAVVESHELEYNPALLRGKLLHAPVPDYRWPSLPQLAGILEKVIHVAERGGRVLIHCLGGRGRSATVAAAYLVARHGYTAPEAIREVRSLRPGAVEHPGQEGVVRALEQSLAVTSLGDIRSLEHGVAELLRVAGIAGSVFHEEAGVGVHVAASLARAALQGGDPVLEPLREAVDELPKLAMLEASHGRDEEGPYTEIKPVMVSWSPVLEEALRRSLERLGKKHARLLGRLVLLEPTYY